MTPNFKLEEFISPDETSSPSEEVVNNLKMLANRLQVIRDLLGRSIKINSGWRSEAHNKKVGGVKDSQHILGKAADIVVDGMSPKAVQTFLEGWTGGLGKYDTFTHIDIRGEKARW